MERSDDGHWIIIDGRRWRATDPAIPEDVAARLRKELMSARRAVRDAGDETEVRRARDRVQAAKVALGERGTPWWEQTMPERKARWSQTPSALKPPST